MCMPEQKKSESILLGFKKAESITKLHAKTFYFASRFLPEEKKRAAYSVYAICRLSDEAVDENMGEEKLKNLTKIQAKVDAVYSNRELKDNLLLAFKHTVNKHNIPKVYFDQLIEGMYMDLKHNRYRDFKELYSYCYKVAGVIGLIMLKIVGYTDLDTEKQAIDLGIAMQLTNILRDIKEDALRGRIYLPQDELQKFAAEEGDIFSGILNERLILLLKFQIERARQYYQNSAPGIKSIGDYRSRLVVCLMKEMYCGILNEIEKNSFNVFAQRAYVKTNAKCAILFKTILRGQYL